MPNSQTTRNTKYKEELHYYKTVADSSFEAIVIIENGRVIAHNVQTRKLLGYLLMELNGISIFHVIHPDFHEIVEKSIKNGIKQPYRIVLFRKDGSSFPCEVQGRLINAGGRNIRITALRDLSEKEDIQEKYKRLVENSPHITYVFSRKNGASFWSARVKEILGFDSDDLLKDPYLWTNSIVEEDRKTISDFIYKSDSNEGTSFRYRIKDKKGKIHWFSDTIFSVIKKDDDVIFEGICEDITDRIKAEKEFKESELNLRFLASSAMEMAELRSIDEIFNYIGKKLYHYTEGNSIITIAEYDLTGLQYELKSVTGIGSWAEKISNLLGFNFVGMKGTIRADYNSDYNPGKLYKFDNDISQMSNMKIPKKVSKVLISLFSIKDVQSISIKHKSSLFGNISILRNNDCKELDAELIEAFIMQVSVFIDRITSTEALRESRLRLSNMIGNIKGVVYRCLNDEHWTMEFLNKEIEILTGYSAEEVILNKKISYANLIHPEDKELVFNAVKNGLLKEQHFIIEYRILTKSGTIKWVWEKGIGIKNEVGNTIHIEGIISDITEIKENEEKIKNQLKQIRSINTDLSRAKEEAEESDRLKSAFLANMSHEIRTPMNSIIGFSEVMGMKDLPEEKKARYLQHISNSGKQLLRLIDDIIDISKIESNQLKLEYQNCNIDENLNELIETCERDIINKLKRNITISFVPDLNLKNPVIRTDQVRFRQILNNLITNAAKYTENGSIDVGYTLKNKESGEYLEFYVRDTGIGISKIDQAKLFSRFYQADKIGAVQGTGLGLSITKALVELLRGKIWFESKNDKGSVFYVDLPYIPVGENKQKEIFKMEIPEFEFKEKLIYIAEDDQSSVILLEEYLEETGIAIKHAENGLKLLELIDQKVPDIVLLDINMPVMNGFKTIKEIRKANNNLRVIAQTAYAMQNEKNAIIAAGCNDYISKPIDRAELIRLLRKYI
ncbi:MAG: PAS domain S-box protein [Bacteroidales bacterium]|nr:PAS domain S-box protein [Bacteroidales bacterium]MCF8392135.1 PAS domain S-box protein [Bacteroidales bacterium]